MKILTGARALLVTLFIYTISIVAAETQGLETSDCNDALRRLVTQQKNDLGIVGLGAMVMRNGEVVASAIAGERKHRSGVLLTDQDKWHIGSITKSFTATMMARLVERGELTWDTTVGDVFTDSPSISDSWRHVTVEQLLTHTSGASSVFKRPFSLIFRKPAEGRDRSMAREGLVLEFMGKEPEAPAGTRFLYSNAGIVIAGVMAERLTGLSWEDLIRKEVFKPLGIESGGFGHPEERGGKLGQPRGHRNLFGITFAAGSDPTLVVGPAGSIHVSLGDLLIYANDHLEGEAGQGKLLKAETYIKLHKPVLDNYAFGWAVSPHEDWADGPVVWHNGSNGMWDALLAILPEANAVIAVTSNDKGRYRGDEIGWPVLESAAGFLKDAARVKCPSY